MNTRKELEATIIEMAKFLASVYGECEKCPAKPKSKGLYPCKTVGCENLLTAYFIKLAKENK